MEEGKLQGEHDATSGSKHYCWLCLFCRGKRSCWSIVSMAMDLCRSCYYKAG